MQILKNSLQISSKILAPVWRRYGNKREGGNFTDVIFREKIGGFVVYIYINNNFKDKIIISEIIKNKYYYHYYFFFTRKCILNIIVRVQAIESKLLDNFEAVSRVDLSKYLLGPNEGIIIYTLRHR